MRVDRAKNPSKIFRKNTYIGISTHIDFTMVAYFDLRTEKFPHSADELCRSLLKPGISLAGLVFYTDYFRISKYLYI